jgi:sulfur relay (sulfurtransferase) DsrC/TusE family protein
MTEFNFLDYDGVSLFTNCLVYQNEKDALVHLLPVIHIGDTQYYANLVNYIQNRICIYENMNLASSNEILQKSVTSLDEYIEMASPGIEEFWGQYKKLLRNFYKKFLTRDIKSVCKMVKKEFKNFDANIQKVYDICIKSGFGIQNLFPIQLYLCDIMNLDHQLTAIDYINDIPNRTNWIHTDLDFAKITQNMDLNEIVEEMLIEPSPEILEILLKQMRLLLTNILGMVSIKKTPGISKKRELLASGIIQFLTQQFEEVKKNTPGYILEERNAMIKEQILNLIEDHEEIVVFYGVAHMGAIERFLGEHGFSLKTQQSFEAFKIEEN